LVCHGFLPYKIAVRFYITSASGGLKKKEISASFILLFTLFPYRRKGYVPTPFGFHYGFGNFNMCVEAAFLPRLSRLESRSHKLAQTMIEAKKCKLLLGFCEGCRNFYTISHLILGNPQDISINCQQYILRVHNQHNSSFTGIYSHLVKF